MPIAAASPDHRPRNHIDTRRLLRLLLKIAVFSLFGWWVRHHLGNAPPALAAALVLGVLALLSVLLVPGRRSRKLRDCVKLAAGLSVITFVLLPLTTRLALWKSPAGLMLAVPLLAHTGWGLVRARAAWQAPAETARTRLERLLCEFIPAPLARLAAAELTILSHIVHFRTEPVVPAGWTAHPYHRLTAPIMWAFLALALLEAAVTHLLFGLWSATAAWVLFVAGDVSVLYIVALIVSLRRLPILLNHETVRIRSGVLFDFEVPLRQIAAVSWPLSSLAMQSGKVVKTSLLTYPNVLLELSQPIPSPKPFGRGGPYDRIALSVDDPAGFVQALRSAARDLGTVS